MLRSRGTHRVGTLRVVPAAAFCLIAIVSACRKGGDGRIPVEPTTVLRVGVAQLSATTQINGLRQLAQILSVESLARPGEDGRMLPVLAEGWTPSADGRVLSIRLKRNVKFHDGSAMDAQTVTKLLPSALKAFMGPVFADIDHVTAVGDSTVEIAFRQPAPFLQESFEAPIQKGTAQVVGTGAFAVVPNSTAEMRSNDEYYLGPPTISTIHVQTYPSARMAWAELLRDRIDMLWEVGSDALDSMKNSSNVSVFTFTRRYQHVIAFNSQAPPLRSAEVRKALNYAVDRATLVHGALNDYGIESAGPIWPHHWALPPDSNRFKFDPQRAADLLSKRRNRSGLKFTCLVSPDSLDERIALEVKRQLAAVGVDMVVVEASRDEIVRRGGASEFEAAIFEVISGPTLFRPYVVWQSQSPFNWGHFGNSTVDAALEGVRRAGSDDQYRTAVRNLQQAFIDDPPAIFLAWSQRARAVSRRFVVPDPEPGREILSNLRLWKPAGADTQASRN